MGRKLGLLLAMLIVVTAAWAWWRLPIEKRDMDLTLKIVEVASLALAALSIVFLAEQIRQQSTWNKHLSYHEYFQEMPSRDRVDAFYHCCDRLGIPYPTVTKPLSPDDVTKILADNPANSPEQRVTLENGFVVFERPVRAEKVFSAYLDDFEEFCAAINRGIVDREYVYDIEGLRTIRAYRGFLPLIEYWRAQEHATRLATESSGTLLQDQGRRVVQSKFYVELETVADDWEKQRIAEGNKAKNKENLWGQVAKWAKRSGERARKAKGTKSRI